jgi:hypothetical protein
MNAVSKALVDLSERNFKKPSFHPTNFSLSSTPPSFQMNTGSLPPPSPTSAAASSLEDAERAAKYLQAKYLQEEEEAEEARAKEAEQWRRQDKFIEEQKTKMANTSGQKHRLSSSFEIPPEATPLNEDEKKRKDERERIMAKQDIVDEELRLLGAKISKITNLKKKLKEKFEADKKKLQDEYDRKFSEFEEQFRMLHSLHDRLITGRNEMARINSSTRIGGKKRKTKKRKSKKRKSKKHKSKKRKTKKRKTKKHKSKKTKHKTKRR